MNNTKYFSCHNCEEAIPDNEIYCCDGCGKDFCIRCGTLLTPQPNNRIVEQCFFCGDCYQFSDSDADIEAMDLAIESTEIELLNDAKKDKVILDYLLEHKEELSEKHRKLLEAMKNNETSIN